MPTGPVGYTHQQAEISYSLRGRSFLTSHSGLDHPAHHRFLHPHLVGVGESLNKHRKYYCYTQGVQMLNTGSTSVTYRKSSRYIQEVLYYTQGGMFLFNHDSW